MTDFYCAFFFSFRKGIKELTRVGLSWRSVQYLFCLSEEGDIVSFVFWVVWMLQTFFINPLDEATRPGVYPGLGI